MIFITYGLLFDIFMNLHRPFNVKFLTRLGGGEFHVTLLNSLPGIIAIFAIIPGSLIINRFRSKKGVVSGFFGAARLFVLALAFVPFVPLHMQPMLFVLLFSLMNFPDAISQTGLQGFLGDVFDWGSRSMAIGLRNKFGQIVAPLIAVITGLIITLVPRGTEAQQNSQAIIIYQIFFATAFIVGIFEIFAFRRFREKIDSNPKSKKKNSSQRHRENRVSAKESLRAIPATLKDRKFLAYMIPTLFFFFTWHAGWPLFGILQVIELGATELQMAINVALSGVFGFIGAGVWNKMIQKRGNDFTCFIASLFIAGGMVLTSLSPNIHIYILIQTLSGFAVVGVITTLLNGLLAVTPEKNRVIYISVYNTFVNISLGLSPFFAYAMLDLMGIRWATAFIGATRFLSSGALFIVYLRSKKSYA